MSNVINTGMVGLHYAEQLFFLKQNVKFCYVAINLNCRVTIAKAVGSFCTYVKSNNIGVYGYVKTLLPSGKLKFVY